MSKSFQFCSTDSFSSRSLKLRGAVISVLMEEVIIYIMFCQSFSWTAAIGLTFIHPGRLVLLELRIHSFIPSFIALQSLVHSEWDS